MDDEPLVLIGMQGMLNWSELGYEVAGTARNGAEALKALRKSTRTLWYRTSACR